MAPMKENSTVPVQIIMADDIPVAHTPEGGYGTSFLCKLLSITSAQRGINEQA